MYANFAINNNTNSSHGRRQETLKKLAKNVMEQASKKERTIEGIVEREYFTKEYIPAEVYIYNISAKTCITPNIEKSLKFLNEQASLKNLPHKDIEEITNKENELFDLSLDDSKNIFAA